ncbi:MAG: hypothetical protein H8D63_02880 [Parcubacteria group bacterium]|nr:hypothetical protein [Parcubacteria group bacterium]
MKQRACRVFNIGHDTPHVSCMGCGAVMLAYVDTKEIPKGLSFFIPVAELEDIEVVIHSPFTQEVTKTYAHYGFVTECPYCILQHEEYLKSMLVNMSIPLTT